MVSLVEKKPPSWLKHTVRKWKELYTEIQRVEGVHELTSPLSAIFRNEALLSKTASTPSTRDRTKNEVKSQTPTPLTSKEPESQSTPQPKKIPKKSKKKQTKGSSLINIKELQSLFNPFKTIKHYFP